jgi:dTDP-4-dehydrorhamnose 3,5-epimerase-like enzyme
MARIITIKTIKDNRGYLTVIQDELPFEVKRIFFIYNADGSERGGHRHYKTKQAAICVSGECKIFTNNGDLKQVFNLNKPDICLLLEPEDYHTMFDFANNATLLVFASDIYDPKDYIHEDYD